MRKIPTVMVSQHPDNASKPYWHTEAFISEQHEVRECYLAFAKLGVSEYKWDWEGKFVEESVFERLISEYGSFFQKNQLGKDKFLTFRIPDFRVETEFRLGRSLMAILCAAGLAKQVGLHSPPLFEVILPMTTSAQEIIDIQEAFQELASLKHVLYSRHNGLIKHIEVIPLFESVSSIINSDYILHEYIQTHKKRFGFSPQYLRPYLARSDSALSSGMVPSVLAIKIALSNYHKLAERISMHIYPILGAGSLPFRGGSTPYSIKNFTKEYAGIRTMLAQSGFQYDFPLLDVIRAIHELGKLLKTREPTLLSDKEKDRLKQIILDFEPFYQDTVKKIGPFVYSVAIYLPPRRERLKHTGLLKYPRKIGEVKIPRAIGFTASLYSIGIPPEFIGTGRGIKKSMQNGNIKIIEKYYQFIKDDLERAGRYINKDILRILANRSGTWKDILFDIQEVEKYLGHEFLPQTAEEKAHKILTHEIYNQIENNSTSITNLMEEAAVLRKSLG